MLPENGTAAEEETAAPAAATVADAAETTAAGDFTEGTDAFSGTDAGVNTGTERPDPRANESDYPIGNDSPGGGEAGGSPSDYSVLRILLTLAVVAAAIYGLVYFVKRAGRGKKTRDPFLKILASTPVAANRSVVVVSLGSQAWLIGSSENGVNLISEIQDQDILNAMIVEDSKRGAAGSGKFTDFKTLLSRLGMRSQTGNEGTEKIRKRRERLKGLQ